MVKIKEKDLYEDMWDGIWVSPSIFEKDQTGYHSTTLGQQQ